MFRKSLVALLVCLSFASVAQAADLSNSQAFTFDDGFGNTLLYRLFFPPDFDNPDKEFPLVLFLHGSGEIGSDNAIQVALHVDGLIEETRSSEHAAFLLAPQVQPGQGGWSRLWSPTELAPAMDLTLQVIEQLEQQYSIDPSRRYVTGLSMGGFGTWDVVAKRPDFFAAAAPMSGGGDPSQAANLRDVPIWNFHGYNDNAVGVGQSREMISAIQEAGGDPLYLESFGPHNIWDPIYDDQSGELYSWMFDGMAPPLASVIYNPDTGNLKIDARSAPGGRIDDFFLRLITPFDLQPTINVDGAIVDTLDFITQVSGGLRYNTAQLEGFGGIADFGPVMPMHLSSEDLHHFLIHHAYGSPATGRQGRTFQLITEIPEPTSAFLAMTGLVGLMLFQRRAYH